MEIINVLLVGKDMEYCKALTESITKLSNEIMISLCDAKDISMIDMDKQQLILLEGEKIGEEFFDDKKFVLMVESKNEACLNIENKVFRLYKYENVKELVRIIYIIFNAITEKSIITISDNNCKLISVFSSFGGSGKTSVSLGLAQELVRFRGKKTLYINYEECDGTWNYFDFQSENIFDSIGNYLYYLNKGKPFDANVFLKEDEYGVNYFKPNLGRNQLRELLQKDLLLFINNLKETNLFDYIIFDCLACLDDSTLWLLKNSSNIIYLAECLKDFNNGSLSRRDTGVLEYLENKFNSSFKEKLITVYNKYQFMELNIINEIAACIETDFDSFQTVKGINKINIERGFGEGIKSIADKIENSLT
jgi:cellulose biosynthesis protein BcsQ